MLDDPANCHTKWNTTAPSSGVISTLDYAVMHRCGVRNITLAAPSPGVPETEWIYPAYPL
ncbi:hypothetical protein FRC08_001887, partial [Ceratobasidium sp. 394]